MTQKVVRRQAKMMVFAVIAVSGALIAFQNCAPGFSAITVSGASADSQGLTGSSPVPTPGTGSSTGTSGNNPSFLFVGAPNKIATFKIDRQTSAVSRLADTPLTGRTPGWFVYDPARSRVFVSDAYGTLLTSLAMNSTSGELVVESTSAIIANVIHFSLYPAANGYQMYAASYDKSLAASYTLTAEQPLATEAGRVSFPLGTDSHSITSDRARGLIFLANKDEGMIRIYTDSGGGMVAAGTVPTAVPRIIMYDPVFNHIYLSTQSSSGNSAVSIYDVVQVAGGYSLSLLASMPIGTSGSDLKIDHSHGFVAATVREPGKEGIWLFPINKTGLFDASRKNTFIPVLQTEARSLQISNDGRYYVVSCDNAVNTAADTLIYEISYNADSSFLSYKLISQQLVGPTDVLANLWVDTSP
jgi:6-phosphogluconolactonase (cycloisomerase 2 family)